jgi:ketosteroid isomerase-like protein
MSQENVHVVRRIHDMWATQGLEAAAELLDPDIEWVNPHDAVEPGTRRGLAEVLGAADSVSLSFEDVALEIEDFIDAGDDVIVIATMHARGRGSGATVSRRQGYVWTIANGRAVRFSWFNDPAAAREAAGLPQAMSQDRVD